MEMSAWTGLHGGLGSLLLLVSLGAGAVALPRGRIPERWRARLAWATQALLTVQVALGIVLLLQGGRPSPSPFLTGVHVVGPLLALGVGLPSLVWGRGMGPRRYVLATHPVFLAALLSFAIGEMG